MVMERHRHSPSGGATILGDGTGTATSGGGTQARHRLRNAVSLDIGLHNEYRYSENVLIRFDQVECQIKQMMMTALTVSLSRH